MKPGHHAGDEERDVEEQVEPSAAPRNSAMSVDIEMSSACTHIPQDIQRG
jgi:hypothetical protein